MIGLGNFLSDDTLTVPTSFKISEVDGLTSAKPYIKDDVIDVFARTYSAEYEKDPEFKHKGLEDALTPVPGKLNILAKLKGKFHGAGLNMIFRPSFGYVRRDNVLEYNLTEEVMQFVPEIGDVPNRGLGRQQDVILKAVPYTQMVWDLLDAETGKADRKNPIPIHFETGMFVRTPPIDFRPKVRRGTISRMASIPHGTTINCQGFEPTMNEPIQGEPIIPKVSILPFQRGAPDDQITFKEFFPQLNFDCPFNLRIPQEIKPGGTLTKPLLNNPNELLIAHNNSSTKKRITQHYAFSLSSDEKISNIPGGGTANIAYLYGPGTKVNAQNEGPNAASVVVTINYWISTVEYEVPLPAGDYREEPKEVVVDSYSRTDEKEAKQVLISPAFKVELDRVIEPNTVALLEATQIQYSQNVTLDFDDMGWPHVSVATLTPLKPVYVPAERIVFKEPEQSN